MGIFTQNIQQLERSLTNEQKKRTYKKEKTRELELYLYNKIYSKFYKSKNSDPDFILGYFQNPDIKKQLLNYTGFLDDIEKSKIYNNILNSIYKDFKRYYNLEIDTSKEEKEQQKKLQLIEKLDVQYLKLLEEEKEIKTNRQKTHAKGINKAINAICIGSYIAGKKHKNKYKI